MNVKIWPCIVKTAWPTWYDKGFKASIVIVFCSQNLVEMEGSSMLLAIRVKVSTVTFDFPLRAAFRLIASSCKCKFVRHLCSLVSQLLSSKQIGGSPYCTGGKLVHRLSRSCVQSETAFAASSCENACCYRKDPS